MRKEKEIRELVLCAKCESKRHREREMKMKMILSKIKSMHKLK